MSEFDNCPLHKETGFTIPNGDTLRMKLVNKYSGGGTALGVGSLEGPLSWSASQSSWKDNYGYSFGASSSAAVVPKASEVAPPAPPAYHSHSMRHCFHCDGHHEPVRQDRLVAFRFQPHVKLNPINGITQPCLGSGLAISRIRVKCELCAESFVIPTGLKNYEPIFGFHVGIPSHFSGEHVCPGPTSVLVGSQ
jgi:hypothetical protein